MNSQALGKSTLIVEVTNISNHGIWLLTGEKELFIPYEEFPWFKDAPIGKILNVEEPTPGHFYWPDNSYAPCPMRSALCPTRFALCFLL